MANKLPLFFNYSDLVVGRTFVAGVRMIARVLAEHDGEKWWLNGVHPGAITESGADVSTAALNFRNALRTIVFEFAAEADTYDSFRATVAKFFDDTDSSMKKDWDDARAAVRAGLVDEPGFARVTNEPMKFDVQKIREKVVPAAFAQEEINFAA